MQRSVSRLRPFLVAFLAAPCLATGPAPTVWPLERIVANLEKQAKESPEDSQTHYTLGRAHAFAFALKRSSLWVFGGDGSPLSIDDLEHQDRKRQPTQANDPALRAAPPDRAELLVHLREGVQHLRRSCELEPKNSQFHLTLAWLVETGAPLGDALEPASVFGPSAAVLAPERTAAITGWIADLGADEREKAEGAQRALSSPDTLEQASPLLYLERDSASAQRKKAVRELLQRLWTERAIREYWSTFELAMAADLAEDSLSLEIGKGFKDLVSYEALDAYRRLVRQRGASTSEEKNLAAADERCKQLEAKPRSSWITPLVLALDCKSLDELVTPDLTVAFDLDGDSVDELWPWIAPDAGWLVWDPQHSGEITSGRQLFGSASGWLFFQDGYRVLDALDDDRSGKLEGAELDGIAVWFDRNTNGVSDRGEVVPVAELGIVALATQSTLTIGASPANLCGLEMADGRVLPTYDWVLESIEE